MDYPEHAKLANVRDRSQVVGEFLDWLNYSQHATICIWSETTEEDKSWGTEPQLVPAGLTIEAWLARFFDIDPKKLNAEKEAMLEGVRAAMKATRGEAAV